ncbi:MAG: cyclic nucleotide-binding/CBS domain-containing protein [Candidatus Bathyarchaeia archaeon]
MAIRVQDVMVKKPLTAQSVQNVIEGAKLMATHDADALVIYQGDKPVGIVTEKDLVQKVLSKELDLKTTPLGAVMSSPLVTVGPDADIAEAAELMNRHHIRRLPVVDKGVLVGVVTSREVVKNLSTYVSKLFTEYFYV